MKLYRLAGFLADAVLAVTFHVKVQENYGIPQTGSSDQQNQRNLDVNTPSCRYCS
jgi:hypothetical protein